MCVMAVTVVIINQLPFLLNFTLLLIVTLINPTSGCAYRKYNRDSYICVCSEYYCDSLLEVEDPGPDHVDVYETNRDGLRFQRSSIRLMPSDMTSQKWIHSGLHHVHVTLKPEIKYQKIIGFGGAFTDAACVNIMSLSTRMADSVIRDYFGTDGLEFNMAKVPIGSNEASRREYSLSPPMDFNLSNFALAEEDLWYKIPLIEKAKVVKPDLKLVASAGSAPHWMTEARMGSFDVAPLKNKPGTIFYKLWAAYQIKFLKAYESMGINFWGLTFANKPFSSSLPNGPEGVPMSPLDEKDFLKYDLGPLLKQAGYGRDRLKVFIMNDIISTAPYWSTIISNDDEAASYISGLAFTWYLKHHIKSSQFILNFLHERWPDYHLLSSEAMVGINSKEKVALGSWARAELYGIDIIEDLNHWTSGWLESSLALDMIGGPNKRSRFADSPVIVNAIYNEYYKQPTFYLLAHFTKFLGGPESIRIGNIIFKIVDNVYFLTALYNQDLAVVIVMNVNDYNLDVRIVGFSGGQLHRKIGSKSIQTYIGRIR